MSGGNEIAAWVDESDEMFEIRDPEIIRLMEIYEEEWGEEAMSLDQKILWREFLSTQSGRDYLQELQEDADFWRPIDTEIEQTRWSLLELLKRWD